MTNGGGDRKKAELLLAAVRELVEHTETSESEQRELKSLVTAHFSEGQVLKLTTFFGQCTST